MSAVPEITKITLIMSKNALGAELLGSEFEFGLFNEKGQRILTAKNDANGLITFKDVAFSSVGVYDYTVKEISAPAEWETDPGEYPVAIEVFTDENGVTQVIVTYPDGVPVFSNTHQCEKCGLVEFPIMTFDAPGVYEFTLKELSPSGNGWTTDDGSATVIVTVVDDGFGNLVATVGYPEGFPLFTNTYRPAPARVTLSACKIAVGAPLPEGKFLFGLFDKHGKRVATALNGPALETMEG